MGCGPRLGPPRVTPAATPATLPLVHVQADPWRWYVVADMGALGERVWFLDTGYAHTTCDDDLVRELGLATKGRVPVRGEGGRVPATRARLPAYTLGEHGVEGHTCVVRDLDGTSSIQDTEEVPIAGVIGMDLLRRFRVEVDPGEAQLVLTDPAGAAPLDASEGGVVRLKRDHPFGLRITVPVRVDGAALHPILDTGATRTLLDTRVLARPPDRVQHGVRVRSTGGEAEQTMTLHWYEVAITLGGHPTPPLEVAERTRHGDGLLGVDVLSRFRFVLDLGRHRARFEPIDRARPPSWRRFDRKRRGEVQEVEPVEALD